MQLVGIRSTVAQVPRYSNIEKWRDDDQNSNNNNNCITNRDKSYYNI